MQYSKTLPIESSIILVRGQRVILASDLARIYGVETRVLNQAVKRNIQRFPDDLGLQVPTGSDITYIHYNLWIHLSFLTESSRISSSIRFLGGDGRADTGAWV
jgi:hypothetical protein